jgi:rhodanese-related sulfurtransferase
VRAGESALRLAQRELPLFDVRFDSERHEFDLDGALNRPIDHTREWLPGESAERMLVSCVSGSRATTVASALQASGHAPVVLIDGGAADLVAGARRRS